MTADFGPIEVFDATTDWTDREIPAADLVSWLHTHAQARRVYLRGARIVRSDGESTSVDLTEFRNEAALVLHNCTVEAPINLDGAVTGRLKIWGCDLQQGLRLEYARINGAVVITEATRIGTAPAMDAIAGDEPSPRTAIAADGLEVAQSLFVTGENTRLDGALRLVGASVGGQLTIGGAQIDADADGRAITAEGLKLTHDLFVIGTATRLAGALRLNGASVGGQLTIGDGAQIDGDGAQIDADADADGKAITADGLQLAQGLFVTDEGTRLGGALRLVGASVGGQLTIGDGAQIDADGDGKTITAEGLKLTHDLFVIGTATRLAGALRLNGASVGGQLTIGDGAQIDADADGKAITADRLQLAQGLFVTDEGTRLGGALRLVGASVGGQLTIGGGAQIDADADGKTITADRLQLAQGLFVTGTGTRLAGALRLNGASVGGQLTIGDGAQIDADGDGKTITAERLKIGQGLFVTGTATRLAGALRLTGATIDDQLDIRAGAQVACDADGAAITADRLQLAQGLFVTGTGTRLAGALRLVGASVGGQLAIRGGAQIDSDGKAITADGLKVGQGLFVTGTATRLAGALRLTGATIDGPLAIHDGAQLAGGLDIDDAEVATFVVEPEGTIRGMVDLSNARVRFLRDTPDGWAQVARGWRLSGITVEALPGTLHGNEGWTVGQRIDWLNKDAARSRRPFTQVAGLYRQAGHYRDGRKVAIAGEKATSGWWRRFWAGGTVRYGYQPWLAAVWAIVLIIVAWSATLLVAPGGDAEDDLFIPADAEEEAGCPDDYPCLNRLIYTIETVLPVVTFDQRDAWRVDTEAAYGQWVQVGHYVFAFVGWVLGLLVVAAVSGVVRQE